MGKQILLDGKNFDTNRLDFQDRKSATLAVEVEENQEGKENPH